MRVSGSLDGKLRVSVNIHYRLGLEDVVFAVAFGGVQKHWTKREMDRATRSLMEVYGKQYYGQQDSVTEDQMLVARDIVLAHYPEFDPVPLRR